MTLHVTIQSIQPPKYIIGEATRYFASFYVSLNAASMSGETALTDEEMVLYHQLTGMIEERLINNIRGKTGGFS